MVHNTQAKVSVEYYELGLTLTIDHFHPTSNVAMCENAISEIMEKKTVMIGSIIWKLSCVAVKTPVSYTFNCER